MLPRLLPLLLAATALSACSQFPELDETVSESARRADYPDLVPVEVLRAGLPEQQITDDTTPALEARVDRLRARAARLRGSVIDRGSRARLSQKVTLPDEG